VHAFCLVPAPITQGEPSQKRRTYTKTLKGGLDQCALASRGSMGGITCVECVLMR
jgi:hypothetical protein